MCENKLKQVNNIDITITLLCVYRIFEKLPEATVDDRHFLCIGISFIQLKPAISNSQARETQK